MPACLMVSTNLGCFFTCLTTKFTSYCQRHGQVTAMEHNYFDRKYTHSEEIRDIFVLNIIFIAWCGCRQQGRVAKTPAPFMVTTIAHNSPWLSCRALGKTTL